MNQGKLDVVKQEMARININMLQISELNQLLVDPKNKFIYLIKVLLWLKKKKKNLAQQPWELFGNSIFSITVQYFFYLSVKIKY